MSGVRVDGREQGELRSIEFIKDFQTAPDGSVLVKWGKTHVLCSVTIEERVPPHRLQSGGGWLTAEYDMLPGSGAGRIGRSRGKVKGRTAEIQRLIGRSLRGVIDLDALPPITITVDCDVVNADGGTRCASITGGYLATMLALHRYNSQADRAVALPEPLSAVSVGIVDGRVLTDICYDEDSTAHVDMNIVSSVTGIVEIQGTGESGPFSRAQLDEMLEAGLSACSELHQLQSECLRRWTEIG